MTAYRAEALPRDRDELRVGHERGGRHGDQQRDPAAPGGGVQYGLLNEILSARGYMLGRSVVNMSTGLMQIAGFAVGGVLVNVLSPRGRW